MEFAFVILANEKHIILADCCSINAESSLHAEARAMLLGLERCWSRNLRPNGVMTDCWNLLEILKNEDTAVAWRMKNTLQKIKSLLLKSPDVSLSWISSNCNLFAASLASLYHQGLELPNWIKDAASAAGLSF